MRVVIADDELLLREGLARLLTEVGFDVVGTAGEPTVMHRLVDETRPDIAIVDIRMPPTHTDEGIVAAQEIRQRHPAMGVLVLSHYVDARFAMRLLEEHPSRIGYLLKERVSDIAVLRDAIHRIGEGECVVDPTIVARLLQRHREPDPLAVLSEREREVLGLIAEGRSNASIAERLVGDRQDRRGAHPQHLRKARSRRGAGRPPPCPRRPGLPAGCAEPLGTSARPTDGFALAVGGGPDRSMGRFGARTDAVDDRLAQHFRAMRWPTGTALPARNAASQLASVRKEYPDDPNQPPSRGPRDRGPRGAH